MARRKLSMQGRIVAAGLSVGVAGALAGFMASGDHTASASQQTSSSSTTNNATPYHDDGDSRATTNDVPQYSPQPQTSTGGS